MSAHLRAGPFRALKMRPVRQEAVHSMWSRLFCGSLKMRRVPEEAVFGTEYPFRTGNACFLHRMLPNIDVQEMAKVSKPTATRLLASLSDYLEVKGTTGKGTHYVVKWFTKGSKFNG